MNSYFVQGQIPWFVYICEVILMFVMAEVSYKLLKRLLEKWIQSIHSDAEKFNKIFKNDRY